MTATEPTTRAPRPSVKTQVWRLAAPIILSNLSTPLIGIVNTAVVGRLPAPAYLGAVAVGALIFDFLFWSLGFLRMGTTGPTAQALGGGNRAEARAILGRALVIALALAVLLIAARGPLAHAGIALIGASPDVAGLAAAYVAVRIWSAPAALSNYVILGWCLGRQRPRTALLLQVLLNGVNAALCVLLVLVLHRGVAGVALAATLAEYAACAAGLWIVRRMIRADGLGEDTARLFDPAAFRRLVAINGDIFVRTLCLMAAFGWLTRQGARMGDTTLAANSVLMNFQTFMAYALDAFAFAAEVLVGEAVGAADPAMLRSAVRTSTLWAAGFAALFALAWAGGGGAAIDLLTTLEPVRLEARRYLIYTVLSPLISVWSFQLDGVFLGATRTAALRNAMIAALLIYIASSALLVPRYGNDGVWIAFLIFMASRAATLGVAYRSRRLVAA